MMEMDSTLFYTRTTHSPSAITPLAKWISIHFAISSLWWYKTYLFYSDKLKFWHIFLPVKMSEIANEIRILSQAVLLVWIKKAITTELPIKIHKASSNAKKKKIQKPNCLKNCTICQKKNQPLASDLKWI